MKIIDTEIMEKFCVGYTRVSSEEQTSNFSIGVQEEAIRREAKVRGYTVSQIFTDPGFSATNTNRPGLIRMLTYCRQQHHISAVMIYKIDRLSRDTADYLGLRKVLATAGVQIVSCTEPLDNTPASQFVETILAAAAMYENEIKRARILLGMMARLKSGLPSGRMPFGYVLTNSKIVTIHPQLGKLVHMAFTQFCKGTYTLKSLADTINKELILLNHPYRFYEQQVSRLLTNQSYIGYAVSKKHGVFKSDKIPVIIDEDVFYRVRSILMSKNKHPLLHQKLREEFVLRGLIHCPECHMPLTGGYVKGRDKYYAYYFCNKHPKSIPVDTLDKAMIELLQQITPDPLTKVRFIDKFKARYSEQYMSYVSQEETIKKKIADLKAQQVSIAKRNIREDIMNAAIDQIEGEILAVKTIKSESKLAQIDIEILTKFMHSFLGDLSKFFMGEYPLELKRTLVVQVFTKLPCFVNGNLESYEIDGAFNLKSHLGKGSFLFSTGNVSQLEPIIAKYYSLYQQFAFA